MRLKSAHFEAIQLLIDTRFARMSERELAARLGVGERTLRRWKAHATFRKAYEEALEAWRRDLLQPGCIRSHPRATEGLPDATATDLE